MTAGVVSVLLALALVARAEEKMPAPRFASFVARLLTYDTTLKGRAGDSVAIAVLCRRGNPAGLRESMELARALKNLELATILDLPVKTLSLPLDDTAELERAVDKRGIDAFVVCAAVPGDDADLKRIAERKKVITIGTTGAQVRAGLAVTVYLEDGKSKILVNHGASKRQGAVLSSDLLRLSEVIP
jgi:hypothetical protein